MTNRIIPVNLGNRAYDIVIGPDLLQQAGIHITQAFGRMPDRIIIVTDDQVAPLLLDTLCAALKEPNQPEISSFIIAHGEHAKSFAVLETLCEDLLAAGLDRGSVLIALGGGVVGDLCGFAASILLRGIDFIQIPTSLLAQIDSSVGGKTGINTKAGKNMIGRFHQPRLVLADTNKLNSLPRRELRAGYAEIVKYGAIDRPDFFSWLEEHGTLVLAGDEDARTHAIATACEAKAAIVAADEHESGTRALLNLGHTFAHALEAEAGYGKLLHGEAVAIGMVLALGLSHQLGLASAASLERLRAHLAQHGLPTRIPSEISRDAAGQDRLLNWMMHDKKARDGRLVFVLMRDIGNAFISDAVSPDQIRTLLADHTF